jgi:hypothetical protein
VLEFSGEPGLGGICIFWIAVFLGAMGGNKK